MAAKGENKQTRVVVFAAKTFKLSTNDRKQRSHQHQKYIAHETLYSQKESKCAAHLNQQTPHPPHLRNPIQPLRSHCLKSRLAGGVLHLRIVACPRVHIPPVPKYPFVHVQVGPRRTFAGGAGATWGGVLVAVSMHVEVEARTTAAWVSSCYQGIVNGDVSAEVHAIGLVG